VIRERRIALPGGITLACREAGAGAPRVLLLHGFPEAAFVWDEVMLGLAPQIACIAPNLRGYGGSSAPAEAAAYKAKPLVGDLVALIEALIQERGAPLDLLVAHDWGGALAWSLAAQRPDLLRRLLIINAPHPATFLRELRDNPAQIAASAYMNYLCRPDAAARLAEDDFARLFGFLGAPAWLTAEVKDLYRREWSRGLEGPLHYYRGSPLRPALAPTDAIHTLTLPDAAVTVQVPTHVLWGERDKALLPALLDGLERWVPRLTVQRLPQASHWLVHEEPGVVQQAIHTLLTP
jgi:epoxide hydrolase 4